MRRRHFLGLAAAGLASVYLFNRSTQVGTRTEIIGARQFDHNVYGRWALPDRLYPPGTFLGFEKWLIQVSRPYFSEWWNQNNLLWTSDLFMADDPLGPYELLKADVLKNAECVSSYYDTHNKVMRWVGIIAGYGQTSNPAEYAQKSAFPYGIGFGPTGAEKGPAALHAKSPFFVTARRPSGTEPVVNGKDMRRFRLYESGNWSSWNATDLPGFEGSEFLQPYGFPISTYGDKLIACPGWLTIDQTINNNSVGFCWSGLAYITPQSSWTTMGGKNWTIKSFPLLETYIPEDELDPNQPKPFDAGGCLAGKPTFHDGMVYIPYSAYKNRHGTNDAGQYGPGTQHSPGSNSIGLLSMTTAEFDALLAA